MVTRREGLTGPGAGWGGRGSKNERTSGPEDPDRDWGVGDAEGTKPCQGNSIRDSAVKTNQMPK